MAGQSWPPVKLLVFGVGSISALAWWVAGRRRRKELVLVHVIGQPPASAGGPKKFVGLYFKEEDVKSLRKLLSPNIELSFSGGLPPSGTEVLIGASVSDEQLASAQESLRAFIVPFAGPPAETCKKIKECCTERVKMFSIHHNNVNTAEMAVALCLSAAKLIVPADQMLRNNDWKARGIPSEGRPDPLNQVVLSGKSALVLGYGAVGRHVARVMCAMGMKVTATRASARARREEDGILVCPSAAWRLLLPETDVLFICLPHTPQTSSMIQRGEIQMLRQGAILVNVGRGVIVDEDALFAELQPGGRLAAAGIDCWYNYPTSFDQRSCTPPSKNHDFASLPNVVMSPHRGGGVGNEEIEVKRMQHLATLLNAYANGDALPREVSTETGY